MAEPRDEGRDGVLARRRGAGAGLALPLAREARLFGTALAFITGVPLGRRVGGDPRALARATRWFPLVGLLVGALVGGVCTALLPIVPSSVAVLCALVAGALVTGAFGEGDLADGAGGSVARRHRGSVRDGRVDGYDALAPVFVVLARFVLLWELTVQPPAVLLAAALAAHLLARWSAVYLMASLPRARPDAADRVVVESVGRAQLRQASLVGLVGFVPVASLVGAASYLLWPLALGIAWIGGRRFRARPEGITDERLGAAGVLVELAVLLAVLLATRA